MLVESQSIYLKFNTQTLINNQRFCPGKNISTQEQTSCEMLLCVFRSLEEVKSSNHVHITVVHNVPARKNFIFGVYILHYNEFLTDGDNLGSGAACVTRTSPGLKNNSLIFYPFCKQVEDRNLFNNALFCLKKVLISFGVLISKIQRNVKVLLRRNNI